MSDYATDCRELLRIAPATLVYDMEHGSEFERIVIADIKRAAGVD